MVKVVDVRGEGLAGVSTTPKEKSSRREKGFLNGREINLREITACG